MKTNRIADLLDGLEFFREFSRPELVTFSPHLKSLRASKGEVIFQEGDPGSYMAILVRGRIAISKGGDDAGRLLCYEKEGRIIGEMALLDREKRSATCVAESDCELLTLSHEGLERLTAEHPQLAYRFMFYLARLLSRRLRRTSGVLVEYLVS
jgi:CRP-like cAMP-binding protein